MKMKMFLLSIICGTLAAQGVGFQLINKTKGSAYLTLRNGEESIINDAPVQKGSTTLPYFIDTKKPTELEVSYLDGSGIETSRKYNFTLGKTIFVTLDGKGLRPQTGPMHGLKGRTESGFPKKNNVSRSDIKQK